MLAMSATLTTTCLDACLVKGTGIIRSLNSKTRDRAWCTKGHEIIAISCGRGIVTHRIGIANTDDREVRCRKSRGSHIGRCAHQFCTTLHARHVTCHIGRQRRCRCKSLYIVWIGVKRIKGSALARNATKGRRRGTYTIHFVQWALSWKESITTAALTRTLQIIGIS